MAGEVTVGSVLVLGSGAREHALAARLASSPSVREVVVAPGNGGTGRAFGNAELASASDPAAVVRLAESVRPGLVVVGPEAPLVAGVADALRAAGFVVFGPGRAAAQLEGSKAFFKAFAARHGVPTARGGAASNAAEAHALVDAARVPPVVKADGLCAGKGVVVAASHDEAHEAIEAMMTRNAFGPAGARVVVEERLEGQEASVHLVLDGERALLLPAVQDHKRLGEGDTGPNTGGMGAYGPAPVVDEAVAARLLDEVVRPTLSGLRAEGFDYRGALFLGLMITPEGAPIVLEYNVRFGDPETAVLTELFEGDFGALLAGAARGALPHAGAAAARGHAAAVVLAAAGYPSAPRAGDVIAGAERAEALEGVRLLHAGTRFEGDRLLTAGGRVLVVSARGDTLAGALGRAYAAAEHVRFEGKQMRRDIGARALGGPLAAPPLRPRRQPMVKRVHNFNPGPATLPLTVLEQARDELLDFGGTGMSILEHSHRGKAYEAVHRETLARLRALLGVPSDYAVLLLQGGAHQQFALVPLNFLPAGGHAAYVVTGRWGEKALEEARNVGDARAAASTEAGGQYVRVAGDDEIKVDGGAAYVHYTTNETVDGVQYQRVPGAGGATLVCDMSSDFLSRPVDVGRYGLIYAGAQKNAGPSGVTIVIVKNDLLARARADLPAVFRYATHAAHDSLYHTAPTFNVYVVCLVLRWLEQKGGLAAIEAESLRKAGAIYAALDEFSSFYRTPVERESRSRVNVVFRLPTPELEAKFLAGAEERGMVGLRGHRSVGGVRASLYNALAPESAELLADHLRAFARSA